MTHNATTANHVEKIMREVQPTQALLKSPSQGDFVVSSWQRCLQDYSIDPSLNPKIPVVESHHLRNYEDELEELSAIAGEEMQNLHLAIQGSGYATILASRDGVILRTICDSGLDDVFGKNNLRSGGDWSEENAGTNGVGTCIRENRAVTIHRDQHFLACNINLSCTGAPIHNPFGDLVAVLDASSVIGDNSMASQMLVRGLVNTTVRSIENQLIKVSAGRQRVVRFHSHMQFLGLQHEALICINDDDVIVAANEIAALLFNQNSVARCLGKHITHFFESESGIPVSDGLLKRGGVLPLRLRSGGLSRVYATLCELPTRRLINHREPVISKTPKQLGLESVAGQDPAMQRVVKVGRRLMDKNISLLLRGETGTGKDVFARALHQASERADKTFVAINCAAIPESLIESELYGYRSGAFTGAKRDGMKGKIEQSDGGTLFLDEIGDMPVALQTRLLRCVEEGSVVPLGGDKPIPVDLHIICATHKDLPKLIEQGEFREDLYYRLNGMCLELVPVRERQDLDTIISTMVLAEAELELDQRLFVDPAAMSALLNYDWPGNFREMRNVVRTAVALCDTNQLTLSELPQRIAAFSDSTVILPISDNLNVTTDVDLASGCNANSTSAKDLLLNAEKQALIQALTDNEWNITKTAHALDMSRNTLYRKLKKHDIKPE